jgi:photosystem II stability/assembly factor-like uncharacterized protein
MRYTFSFGLALLLLGTAVFAPGTGRTRPAWWVTTAAPFWPDESNLAVLAVPTGPVGAVALDPGDALTIYLGGAEGLFRSTDGGETWDLLSHDLRYPHILLVDPAERSRLYAARRDFTSFLPMPAVYRSDDGGYTWKRLVNGLGEERIFALAADPFRRGTLYAGSWAGRVYKTQDRGEHWQPLAAGVVRPCPACAPSTVSQLLVSPVDGTLYALETYGGTYRSADGGETWAQINGDSGWLAVDPGRGDLYLAGRRLQHSTDSGTSWTDLSAGLPFNAGTGTYATYWIAVNPVPLVLFTRYHRSTDGGATWQSLETPASFVPRLLLPGVRPAIYGSVNGQAARYEEPAPGGTR